MPDFSATLNTDFPNTSGIIRPRRLRQTAPLRKLVSETVWKPQQLILPVFVADGLKEPREITSMPGQMQHSLDSIRKLAVQCAEAGIGGIDLFGIPKAEDKDSHGSLAWQMEGILNQAITAVAEEVGDELVIIADTCLDEFTSHGHCGVLNEQGQVDNDATVKLYCEMALAQAAAGTHLVSPSGMMDGQVKAIRNTLDNAGYTDVGILAYSAKYASAFFGPFRDAVSSSLQGDRFTYQQDPANRRESQKEVLLDIAEGADIVMVKPAGYYLDIVSDIADLSVLPVAAYQVSGEYAMITAASRQGWVDRDRIIRESITGIFRAGADMVFTYFALDSALLS